MVNSGKEHETAVQPAIDLAEAEFIGEAGLVADVVVLEPDGARDAVGDAPVILELEDLLPDTSGEVVLFAEEDVPVNILTHESVTEAGIADAHVTASGLDVTGLHYYSFESGITLYSPSDVLIIDETGAV